MTTPIPMDLTALRALSTKASELAERVDRAVQAHNAKEALERSNIEARVASISNPQRRGEAHALYMAEHAEWLKGHRRETEESRWTPLRELNILREAAMSAKELIGSPIVVATSWNLGKPERSAIAAEIAGLGPAALANLARRAELTGDRNLAAALVVANDKLPRGERPFNSQSLADKVFGKECQAVNDLVKHIDVATAKAIAANRAADGKPLVGVERISNALKHGPAINHERKFAVPSRSKTPTQRISEGLLASEDFGG